jgi:hypothetical protein
MSTNDFSISSQSYEHALQLVEQALAAMARAKAVEGEIRFTKYRLNVSPDDGSAAARLRLLQGVLDEINMPPAAAPISTQTKPRNWA